MIFLYKKVLIGRSIHLAPGTSHHGRIWERQIGSIRKHLNAICHEQLLIDAFLIPLKCEIEAIINSCTFINALNDPFDWSHSHPTTFCI